jgi:quercetin dioxygenase-like cupin family protein
MKRGILSIGFAVIVALAFSASAGNAASSSGSGGTTISAPTVILPSAVKWVPVKGMAPLQTVVLYGDPTKSGSQYAVRLNVPDGFKFPVHSHPMLEEVTVLSGTFMVGVGDKWDTAKMTALPAGTFVAIPPNLKHYGVAKGDTILELHGIGPDKIIMAK